MTALWQWIFRTKPALDEKDFHRSERGLLVDAVGSMSMVTLQGGPFLAAFAIALGASNYEVGLLATIAFGSQLMQLPGLMLVQKFPRRRGLTVLCAAVSRLLWIFIILIPLLFINRGTTFLMQWLVLAAAAGAMAGPAWNSLVRDIVPPQRMGQIFSRRMTLGTISALLLTIGGGYFVDFWKAQFPDYALYAYAMLFALGLVFGLIGLVAISRIPEPQMAMDNKVPIWELLARPIKDPNFRGLLKYIAGWNFAINLAGPFFIIYLLERIGLSLGMVTILVVTSQLTNIIFLRIWGKLADRYSNKSVLAVSSPLFLLAIFAWTFTTLPETHTLTLPLLFAIHILSGMAVAGVTLGSTNIALKLSPEGQAHAYLTAYGLAGAVAGATAPMLGGMLADFFAMREMQIPLQFKGPNGEVQFYAFSLRALDFLFLLAGILGIVALRFLRSVKEAGEVERGVVREQLVNEAFGTFRAVSTMPGLRFLVGGPVSAIYRMTRVAKPLRDALQPNGKGKPELQADDEADQADEADSSEDTGEPDPPTD